MLLLRRERRGRDMVAYYLSQDRCIADRGLGIIIFRAFSKAKPQVQRK